MKLSDIKDDKLRQKVLAQDAIQNAKQLGRGLSKNGPADRCPRCGAAMSGGTCQNYGCEIPPEGFRKEVIASGKRLRQSEKPLMNKLESQYFEVLKRLHPGKTIHAQDKTFRLCNGLRYTPDFTALLIDENGNAREHAWETKGKWVDGDSFPKLKMFASVWPEIVVTLVWKDGNCWREQRILA